MFTDSFQFSYSTFYNTVNFTNIYYSLLPRPQASLLSVHGALCGRQLLSHGALGGDGVIGSLFKITDLETTVTAGDTEIIGL
jgi:hypothetical protein